MRRLYAPLGTLAGSIAAFVTLALGVVIVDSFGVGRGTAHASASDPDIAPLVPAECARISQGPMMHVFDTSAIPGGPYYVNDHTVVQAADGSWHLFGIFKREPIGDGAETELVHAVAEEPDPSRWREGAFVAAPDPYRIALRAQTRIGETHLWAPHVLPTASTEGRYVMAYQSGGRDDYHAGIRLAESDDLYRWTRIGEIPLFEDFCEARDPMLVRGELGWVLYYTRCDGLERKASGVAYRLSRDLVGWSAPRMALTLRDFPATSNSAFTESPFVFEHDGYWYLSVSAYPISWDATYVYRSRSPFEFPDAPYTRLRAHAAEWIFGGDGRHPVKPPNRDDRAWLTHAGPGQRGVWISRVEP